MVSPDVRRQAFAQFVKRATDQAKLARGWSVPRIAAESRGEDGKPRVSANTIYRWRRGDWETVPKPEQIEAFCDTLDIPTAAAFVILWPGRAGQAPVPEPLVTDPDFEVLQRRLNDPSVSEREKFHIRETIRTLALRRG
jgi:hypothetical protein